MAKTYGPYSPIRKSGNILFVSGQVGLNPETESVPEGVSAQTTQALQNMDAVLHTVGASLSNVVKTTVFLTNMDDFATMNEAYAQMFPEPRPARSAIRTTRAASNRPTAARTCAKSTPSIRTTCRKRWCR